METSLKIAGGLLGILVPYLFIITINKGIKSSEYDDERKLNYRQILWTLVTLGTLSIWILSLSKVLDYHEGDVVPRFVIPLVAIVLLGLWLLGNEYFQSILSTTSISALVGVQAFRLAGTAFFLIAYLKKSTNARFLFWVFNAVGLLDLINVAFLLLFYYPLWNKTMPTSEAATQFSLIMIPAIAAPFALLLHIYSIIGAVKPKEV